MKTIAMLVVNPPAAATVHITHSPLSLKAECGANGLNVIPARSEDMKPGRAICSTCFPSPSYAAELVEQYEQMRSRKKPSPQYSLNPQLLRTSP